MLVLQYMMSFFSKPIKTCASLVFTDFQIIFTYFYPLKISGRSLCTDVTVSLEDRAEALGYQKGMGHKNKARGSNMKDIA